MTVTEPVDLSTIPGAFEHELERTLDNGTVIRFESSPAGWLLKSGERRKSDWRAYWASDPGEKRRRMPSVTTLLGDVCPKDLTRYGEMHGILGALEAVRRGELPIDADDERAVATVRALKLGADAARDRRATEGVNVHKLLEDWMTSGRVPNPADHPPEVHGYIQALARAVMALDPEPVHVEHLVYSREHRYAGRVDLLCRIDGRVTLLDLKTNPRGSIYATAHAQCALYWQAMYECGDVDSEDPCARIVVLAADGAFRAMDAIVTPETVRRALDWRAEIYPIDQACMTHNRAERDARRAA